MYLRIRAQGRRDALTMLGLAKLANEEPTLTTGQGAAMGAAALAPFAGLIGQKPVIHDPTSGAARPATGAQYATLEDLARAARTGDIVVTSSPGGGILGAMLSSSPDTPFYHTEAVVSHKGGKGRTIDVADLVDASWEGAGPKERIQWAPELAASLKERGYTDAVLLRPKDMSTAEKNRMAKNVAMRASDAYDTPKQFTTWLRNVFMPKIEGLTDKGTSWCGGNICSTMPAAAAEEATKGRHQIVPGLRAKEVLPSDYMRSENYDFVGSHLTNQLDNYTPIQRKMIGLATRGTLGAGLAGATYAVSEDPALAAAPIGAMAGQSALRAGLKRFAPEQKAPRISTAFNTLMGADDANKAKILKTFGKRTLPAVLGGAGLAYAAGKGIEHGINKLKEE